MNVEKDTECQRVYEIGLKQSLQRGVYLWRCWLGGFSLRRVFYFEYLPLLLRLLPLVFYISYFKRGCIRIGPYCLHGHFWSSPNDAWENVLYIEDEKFTVLQLSGYVISSEGMITAPLDSPIFMGI